VLHCGPLSYYNLEDKEHGNGCCDMMTKYWIKSAKIIEDKRKIDLGD
jgi:hypothetical protein